MLAIRTLAVTSACLLLSALPAALAQQAEPFADYENPLAESDVFENPFADDDSLDDIIGLGAAFDFFTTEAEFRSEALFSEEGWNCITYGLDDADEDIVPSHLIANPDSEGAILLETTPIPVGDDVINLVIEYKVSVMTDATDSELNVISNASTIHPPDNLPDGLEINDPGPIELAFDVIPDEEMEEGYLLRGTTKTAGHTSGFACAPA